MADSTIRRIVSVLFDRASAKKTEAEMEASLAKAGEGGGKKAGQDFLRELRAAFNKRKAQLQVDLAAGIIDKKEFQKQADIAARQFNSSLTRGMKQFHDAGKLTDAEFVKLSRSLKRVGDEGEKQVGGRLTGAFKRAAIAAAALFSFREVARWTREIVGLGVAGEETASKYQTTFGAATETMDEFIESFRNLAGLSKNQAREFTATIGAMARGMGFTRDEAALLSQEVLRVAGDLTSFNNVPLEQTLRAVRSAITGERESLKTLGIVVMETDVQQRAMAESGKENAAALTQQEKAAATLALIQERMGPAAGDLVRTQDSLANQARRTAAAYQTFREELGKVLASWDGGTPLLERVTNLLNTMTANVHELVAAVKSLIAATAILAGARALWAVRTALIAANAAALTFGATLRSLLTLIGPAGWFVLGVGALAEVLRRAGRAARDAAKDAREAQAELQAGASRLQDFVADLDKKQAAATKAAAEIALAQTKAQLAAAKATLEAAKASPIETLPGGLGIPNREALRARSEAIERERKAVEALTNQQRTQEAVIRGATAALEQKADVTEDTTDKSKDALAEEIKLLAQGEKLRQLSAKETLRVFEIEAQVTEALRGGNLTLEKRVALAQKLQDIHAVTRAILAETAEQRTPEPALADTPTVTRRIKGEDRELITPQFTPGAVLAREAADAASIQEEHAKRVENAWVDALRAIDDEVRAKATLIGDLAFAWANGGIAGVAALAAAKVKENFAAAVEAGARALGFLAIGNPKAAAEAATSAKQHFAAMAAWKAAESFAGGGGGGGGARGGGGGSFQPANTQPRGNAGNTDPQREVTIHLHGSMSAMGRTPEFQRMLAKEQAAVRQRYGANTRVVVVSD